MSSPTNDLEPGVRVRFTSDNLGAMATPGDVGFVATVGHGIEGIVECHHPNLEPWVIVAVKVYDLPDAGAASEVGEVYVPVHPSHVEVIR